MLQLLNTSQFLPFSFGAGEETGKSRAPRFPGCLGGGSHKTLMYSLFFYFFRVFFFWKYRDRASISRHSCRFLKLQLGITQRTSNGARG